MNIDRVEWRMWAEPYEQAFFVALYALEGVHDELDRAGPDVDRALRITEEAVRTLELLKRYPGPCPAPIEDAGGPDGRVILPERR